MPSCDVHRRPPRTSPLRLRLLLALLCWNMAPWAPAAQAWAQAAPPVAATAFARQVDRLSEPGGYFDTDNLISNEASYLHVLGGLRAHGVTGGAYIGVGPDQNFSYIAATRPAVAYLIDIRRDNMLQHLLFKAMFSLAEDRGEYLRLLLGRPAPPRGSARLNAEALVAHFVAATPEPDEASAIRRLVAERVATFGVPLSENDRRTMERFHRAFIAAGMNLQFESFGRAPRSYYPTYRELLLERDLGGRQGNYLATEAAWRVVRDLQARDLVIPVVGNLAGSGAMRAIAADIEARGLAVSAFYTSNVEFYLMADGSFPRFVTNLRALPRTTRSVIIRSYFGSGFRARHPQAVAGYASTQLLQVIDAFFAEHERGGITGYSDLVTRGVLDPVR